jgi:hypothetical protein
MSIPNIPNEGFDKNKGTINQNKADIDKLKSKTETVNKKDEALKPVNYQGATQETLHKTIMLGDLARANASNDKILDVAGVYIVMFNYDGTIAKDVNGNPMYAKLYGNDYPAQDSIVWNITDRCWAFKAYYAD